MSRRRRSSNCATASCRRSASRATSLRLRPVRLAWRASWRLKSGSNRIVRAEVFMSDNVIQAAPPNKRLKLAGRDRLKGSGVLCPWRGTDFVPHPCAGRSEERRVGKERRSGREAERDKQRHKKSPLHGRG